MNARRTDWQDLLFGLFLIAVAGIALAATRTLSGGNAADMGPGYMPRAIAIMLLASGSGSASAESAAPLSGSHRSGCSPCSRSRRRLPCSR